MRTKIVAACVCLVTALAAGAGRAETYADDIAPLMQKHCIGCHRPGVGTPFTLMNFGEVSTKAKTILHVTQDGKMPPWKPERGHTPLLGERGLSDAEKDIIKRWVEQGTPEGDPAHVPPTPVFPESGWRLGTPDLVVEMTEPFDVPADGPDIYRNFVVPLPELPAGKWLKAVEFRAGTPAVVHHCLLDLDYDGRARQEDADAPGPGFEAMDQLYEDTRIAAFAVGGSPYFFPEGVAYAIPKGTDLVLESHFHPTGKAEQERSRVGLYLTDQAPVREMVNLQVPPAFGLTTAFRIPAGDPAYTLEHSFTLSHDVQAVQLFPHAHYLCKQMKCVATLPSGEAQVLIWIKDWDFAWQEQYAFANNLILPAGTVLSMTWVFDNSAGNPFNPNHPPRDVQWGRQTTDEMASMGLEVIPVRAADTQALRREHLKYTKRQYRDMPTEYLAAVVGKEIHQRFDHNHDGILSPTDLFSMGNYWRRTVQLHRGHPSFEVERVIIFRGAGTYLAGYFKKVALLGGIFIVAGVLGAILGIRRWRRRKRAAMGSHG